MQRWFTLSACVLLQSVLGGIYAWSVFVPSLTAEYGLTKGQCGLVFGSTIAVFTILMLPAGRLLGRFGPRKIASLGAVLFCAGYLLASVSDGSFALILTGIGIIQGAGIGVCYVCPLTVAMKWFPEHKGLVTGAVVAGFGGGAVIISQFVKYMLSVMELDVMRIFGINGILFGAIIFAASQFLKEPAAEESVGVKISLHTIRQYIRSRPFITLMFGMFAGTFAGLLVVGNLKPIILQDGFDDKTATLAISVFAIGNAAGRIIWGQVHDKLGVRKTVLMSLAFLAVSLVPLTIKMPAGLLLAVIGIAGAGFGACFVVYAASIVKFYGTELFSVLYPICFLGYGFAGITGPAIGGWLADTFHSFGAGIIISIMIILAALILNKYELSAQNNIQNNFNMA